VTWTKLPNEPGYDIHRDGEQQQFFGLPSNWRQMTDVDVDKLLAEKKANQPWEERDKWPYELMKPTVC
jgi:hypothetical protein